jgi:hypothetical protein
MAREQMVRGMPTVESTNELCEACLAGGEAVSNAFPQQAKFRAEEPLKLVDVDLCGAITPPTVGGRRYFLFLVDDVDDYSRYMWLVLLLTKDEPGMGLKRFKLRRRRRRGASFARCAPAAALSSPPMHLPNTSLTLASIATSEWRGRVPQSDCVGHG